MLQKINNGSASAKTTDCPSVHAVEQRAHDLSVKGRDQVQVSATLPGVRIDDGRDVNRLRILLHYGVNLDHHLKVTIIEDE